PAQADLQDAPGVDQSLLMRAAQEGRMIDLRAAQDIQRVGMRVEMQDPDRSALGERTKDGERYGVVAAHGDGPDLELPQALEEALNGGHRPLEAQGIDRRVAEIGDVADLEGRDAARRVQPANEARGFAHAGRALARAGTEVDPEVEGDADEPDIHLPR